MLSFLPALARKAVRSLKRVAELCAAQFGKIIEVAKQASAYVCAKVRKARIVHALLMRNNPAYRQQLLVLAGAFIAVIGLVTNWSAVMAALAGLYVATHMSYEQERPEGYPGLRARFNDEW